MGVLLLWLLLCKRPLNVFGRFFYMCSVLSLLFRSFSLSSFCSPLFLRQKCGVSYHTEARVRLALPPVSQKSSISIPLFSISLALFLLCSLQAASDGQPRAKKAKDKVSRVGGGQKWHDATLEEWDPSKFLELTCTSHALLFETVFSLFLA